MSSLMLSFFCFTKRIGVVSSVDAAAGTLMRYSLPIGLNTCWTRSRFADSRVDRTDSGSSADVTAGLLP